MIQHATSTKAPIWLWLNADKILNEKAVLRCMTWTFKDHFQFHFKQQNNKQSETTKKSTTHKDTLICLDQDSSFARAGLLMKIKCKWTWQWAVLFEELQLKKSQINTLVYNIRNMSWIPSDNAHNIRHFYVSIRQPIQSVISCWIFICTQSYTKLFLNPHKAFGCYFTKG